MEELRLIQDVLNAPKSKYNEHSKFNYRSCEDILAALKPLLKEHNSTLSINDDLVLLGDRFYIKSVATFTNSEGAKQTANGFAREEDSRKGMSAGQLTGATSSYSRKYALNALYTTPHIFPGWKKSNSGLTEASNWVNESVTLLISARLSGDLLDVLLGFKLCILMLSSRLLKGVKGGVGVNQRGIHLI